MTLPGRANPYQESRQPLWLASLLGPLELVSPPSGLVVSLGLAKQQCRVDPGNTAEDALLTGYLRAAQRLCEREIAGQRQFLTATYSVPVLAWWGGPLRLPLPPLQSVVAVTYYDTGGNLQTLDPAAYLVRTPLRLPGTIERAPSKSFPAVQGDRRLPIAVTFTAGYGAAAQVPDTIVQAILLLVGYWYDNRAAAGTVPGEIAFGVQSLLEAEGYGGYA